MSKAKDNQYLDELIEVLRSKSSAAELKLFLQAILTPAELQEIPKRLQIIKLLKSGMSQADIVDTLGVGRATVTRGSKELQKGSFKEIE